VKFLVENGADINEKTNDGSTTLHIASFNGHLAVVKYLKDNMGCTPLTSRFTLWSFRYSEIFDS
jgi:ankyrin repeat protein